MSERECYRCKKGGRANSFVPNLTVSVHRACWSDLIQHGKKRLAMVKSKKPAPSVKLKLAEALRRHGISKNEFARILGVPTPTVRPYFSAGYDPKLSTVVLWAEALGCKVEDLYERA